MWCTGVQPPSSILKMLVCVSNPCSRRAQGAVPCTGVSSLIAAVHRNPADVIKLEQLVKTRTVGGGMDCRTEWSASFRVAPCWLLFSPYFTGRYRDKNQSNTSMFSTSVQRRHLSAVPDTLMEIPTVLSRKLCLARRYLLRRISKHGLHVASHAGSMSVVCQSIVDAILSHPRQWIIDVAVRIEVSASNDNIFVGDGCRSRDFCLLS